MVSEEKLKHYSINFLKSEIDKENSINEMVEAAKKECVSEIVSDLKLKDSEGVIGEIFGLGVKIGICNILEVINSVAASSNEDSVLHVMFDETTGPVS